MDINLFCVPYTKVTLEVFTNIIPVLRYGSWQEVSIQENKEKEEERYEFC